MNDKIAKKKTLVSSAMKSAMKSSGFKKSGPKSAGGKLGGSGKDFTKQLMVERKET